MIELLWVPLLLPAAVIVVTMLLSRLERFATRTRTANDRDAPALPVKVKGVRDQGGQAVKSLAWQPRQAVGVIARRLAGPPSAAIQSGLAGLRGDLRAVGLASGPRTGPVPTPGRERPRSCGGRAPSGSIYAHGHPPMQLMLFT